ASLPLWPTAGGPGPGCARPGRAPRAPADGNRIRHAGRPRMTVVNTDDAQCGACVTTIGDPMAGWDPPRRHRPFRRWFRMQSNCGLTRCIIARHWWRPKPNFHAIFATRAGAFPANAAVSIATITTTTGTIGAGVRARVQG